MDEFYYTATQDLPRPAGIDLPERPYKYHSEIMVDWFRYFDALTGGSDALIEDIGHARGKRDKQSRRAALRAREEKLWHRWDLTKKSSRIIPLFQYARSKAMLPDEIKILLFIFYKTMVRNPMSFDLLALLHELYGDYTEVFINLPMFRSDRLFMREGLIVPAKSIFGNDAANFDFAREFVLSEECIRFFCGLDRRFIKPHKDKNSNKGHDDLLWIMKPTRDLSQVILKPKVRRAIDETLLQVQRRKTFGEWGFDQVLEKGRAVAMLFFGPPGTGKTLTAEAIAGTLKRRLAVVNVAGVRSKWFGETEKNLVKIFQAAEKQRSVLLLDEADSLLASRDSTEHYMHNREVSILLRMFEDFEGIAILTTNMATILDPALERRINPKIEFPPPDFAGRVALWQALIPKKLPLAPDVNLEVLAERYLLTGGQIKNAVVSAARAALAKTDPVVTMASFIEACELEQGSLKQDSGQKPAIGFGRAV